MSYKLEDALSGQNIAEMLDDETLQRMGSELVQRVEEDDQTRAGWLENQDQWLKLATQIKEEKNFPWQNAANIKYPLLTIAATQFHARALPNLINSNKPVMARVIGEDTDGSKLDRATRVAQYMSYQILEEMEEWLDEMDRLMFILPIVGLAYKKTYYSEIHGRLRSVLLLPREVIVDYYAQDYQRARVTHVMLMDPNEIIENQRSGVYMDVELEAAPKLQMDTTRDEVMSLNEPSEHDDDPRKIYEIHGWWDLDDDGYREPYIITVDSSSEKVLRIAPRFEEEDVILNEKGDVVRIQAVEYFTPYKFIPDPNSSVYGLGFGSLLGPINEAINTNINQLIDAGTLSNMQSGFIARGVKVKGGVTKFSPGEWKLVNSTPEGLKNGVVPLPVREPSSTLFNLLSLLIESGERISAVSDIMLGENPGQNQPATTSMAVLEQGLKVFTGIYKRIFRQLTQEYKKIFYFNGKYIDEERYQRILDRNIEDELGEIAGQASPEELEQVRQALQQQNAFAGATDFNDDEMDIVPAADPNLVSEAQRLAKSNSLLEKMGMGLPPPKNPFLNLLSSALAQPL